MSISVFISKGILTVNDKIESLKNKIIEDGLDGLVISSDSDIKYLTNFSGEYGVSVLLLTRGKNYFITDGRYTNQAKEEIIDFEVIPHNISRNSNYYKKTGDLIQEHNLKICGYYGADISYKNFTDMAKQSNNTKFVEAISYIKDMRAIKTPDEILKIKEACKISTFSFYAILDFIKSGVTEIEIANELEHQFRMRGGEGACFPIIVASGPDNGANCHNTVTDRKIERGDFITIDFGTYFKGYCSDITRTISVGEPKNNNLKELFKIVTEAKRAGENILKPGIKMSDLHKVINEVIEDKGYNIPHGPGHSFGLTVHEDPFITSINSFEMKPGVVHTLEPGIYIPGFGGVRQEDDYLITEDGYERLTHITDELIIL